jgi:hypothetical protein
MGSLTVMTTFLPSPISILLPPEVQVTSAFLQNIFCFLGRQSLRTFIFIDQKCLLTEKSVAHWIIFKLIDHMNARSYYGQNSACERCTVP